jgi:hypothetical protein
MGLNSTINFAKNILIKRKENLEGIAKQTTQ